ncbi:MAG: zinc chelation protein SecC [Verrucomicrobia bacterium]|nr:zinc chelation protein SecC [Verrucomicrobiota bacterium]
MGNLCPCHSGSEYSQCCKPYHEGRHPPTALALMRSRYSAYALNNAEYIIKTTHPKSPYFEKNRKAWIQGILEFSRQTQFVGLDILGSGENWVHFSAKLRQNGSNIELNEKSHFEKIDDQWLYLSGEVKKLP